MLTLVGSHAPAILIWVISAAALVAILLRPRGIPEWVWAVAGAVALVGSTLLPFDSALRAVERGFDVYLFLAGMMALSELARGQGVFDWLAVRALRAAGRSKKRLFVLVYFVGTIVTALLSNDATAVVLTPAVFAGLSRTDADPLPFLYACAFISNAASFVLPISNPANLVVFGGHLPRLGPWLLSLGVPALAAVAGTLVMLYLVMRTRLQGSFRENGPVPELSKAGRVALGCVIVSAVVLVVVASLGKPIGITTAVLGLLATLSVTIVERPAARAVIANVSWSIVPLVAGLFVIVQALDRSGVLALVRSFLQYAGTLGPVAGNLLAGSTVALASNALNNLPVGLISGYALSSVPVSGHIANATLIGVDLGPNLSVTGSLATILWLVALRRGGVNVTPGQFLKIGFWVLVPTLAAALCVVR